jgi:hypothetical protein
MASGKGGLTQTTKKADSTNDFPLSQMKSYARVILFGFRNKDQSLLEEQSYSRTKNLKEASLVGQQCPQVDGVSAGMESLPSLTQARDAPRHKGPQSTSGQAAQNSSSPLAW